ncbi:polygalacturonase inhibitor 1-like [Cynara cardunculus var. scolymus]|uniref:polygalacturonase inhibitor 1-like n=1 Tax=Cynara cardunculus var. scolymus TaxID=59895 RepID=UPI000D628D8E|nr:polygalacturonase inhibitor 1-like [Cynara cardunculus var. scolymus]
MIWFYFIILLLLRPNAISVAASLGNQLVAVAEGGGDAVIKCFHKEKQALLHFKASLQDPLGQLSTWRLEDDDCCKWSGVTCNNQTRHVTKIDLSSNPLTGLRGLGDQTTSSDPFLYNYVIL